MERPIASFISYPSPRMHLVIEQVSRSPTKTLRRRLQASASSGASRSVAAGMGVEPSSPHAFGSAPAARISRTASGERACTAARRGPSRLSCQCLGMPSGLGGSTAAPRAISARTRSTSPASAASISGVNPSACCLFTSAKAPARRSASRFPSCHQARVARLVAAGHPRTEHGWERCADVSPARNATRAIGRPDEGVAFKGKQNPMHLAKVGQCKLRKTSSQTRNSGDIPTPGSLSRPPPPLRRKRDCGGKRHAMLDR